MVALRNYFEEILLFASPAGPWAFRCTICAALVVDRETHLGWHQRHDDIPEAAAQ